MFPSGTVERFDVSHWYCGEIRRITLVLWRDSTFHTEAVERFDISHWYCGEIRRFTMVLWRDSTFHNGTVERFDGNECCVTQVSLLPVVRISQVPLV